MTSQLVSRRGEKLAMDNVSAYVLGSTDEMTEEEKAACVFIPDEGDAEMLSL